MSMPVNVLTWLDTQFLKMEWLNEVVRLLVERVFGLSISTKVGGSVRFFIYDTVKIF